MTTASFKSSTTLALFALLSAAFIVQAAQASRDEPFSEKVNKGVKSASDVVSSQFESVKRFFSIPSEDIDETRAYEKASSAFSKLKSSLRKKASSLFHKNKTINNKNSFTFVDVFDKSFDDDTQADDAFIPFMARQVEPSAVPSLSSSTTPTPSPTMTTSGSISSTPKFSSSTSTTVEPTLSTSPSVTPTVSVTSTTTATAGTSASSTPSVSTTSTPSSTVGSSTTPTSTIGTTASPTISFSSTSAPSNTPTPTAALSFGASPSSTITATSSTTPSNSPTISNTPRSSPSVPSTIFPPTPTGTTSMVPPGESPPPSQPPCICRKLFIERYGRRSDIQRFGTRNTLYYVGVRITVFNSGIFTEFAVNSPRRFLSVRYKLDFTDRDIPNGELSGSPYQFPFKFRDQETRVDFISTYSLSWFCFPEKYPITMKARVRIAAPGGRFGTGRQGRKQKTTQTLVYSNEVLCQRFSSFFSF